MECKKFGLSIGDYLEDCLDSDDRRAFRRHLQRCGQCRAEAIESEPSLLFAVGNSAEPDEQAVVDCADAVTALIRQDRLQHRLAPRSRHWLAAAAVCVVVLGGGLVWRYSPWNVNSGPIAVAVADSEETTKGSIPPPRVEVEMPGSDVRLYQFAGSEDETTAVYFVVNEAMDL